MSPINQRPIREVIYEMATDVAVMKSQLTHHLCETCRRHEETMRLHDERLNNLTWVVLPAIGSVSVIGLVLAILKMS